MVLLSNVHEEGRCDTVIRVFSKMVAGVPGPLDSMNLDSCYQNPENLDF
jgi:hypothetical protein